jgi:hypothetical protein
MNESQHRVTKQICILAVIESPRNFIKVGRVPHSFAFFANEWAAEDYQTNSITTR